MSMDNQPENTTATQDPNALQEQVEKKYTSQAEQDGFVEIVNADGSKSQVKKEVAQAMVDNLENIKRQLGQ